MKVFAFVLMIFLPTLASAEPIFPQYKSCMDGKDKSNGCTIFLDESGFLVDAATGGKVVTTPESMGAISSNWLYQYGNKYILENQNLSSSKTRQWVTFEYERGKIVVDRVYSFSTEISMQSGPTWYGYECRGNSIEVVGHAELSLSELAMTSVCGEAVGENIKVKEEAPSATAGGALAVSIPIYTAKKISGAATYLFMESNEPDIFRMACYSGCALKAKDNSVPYVGRIAKSAWFFGELQDKACQSSGSYKYKSSSEQIVLNGCIGDGIIKMTEYLPGTKIERAQFIGKTDGEGYKGEWVSKSGDNKKFVFFMFPLTVY
ncbi:hypothetical protein PUP66_00290 [Pseudomonas chlororaphis]|uniref:hypothetical protein n=1 Tax=Pseudomonas chlororaphis TaxID=587753 RepID=UPI000F55950B|nr:hypothetical protein [Pseudomonas chlororaphis]AZD18854.1 hypothetical protein C4K25_5970 [Pseudomonas chlororaphis]WDH47341.1 hypothetical protein PUP66_00290 [Pseudomonas chlororaphis]WDH59188.1 hypothetical protein PUP56_00290 [Pseudomonas chlororaphis]WQE18445.1 hypothetical protein U0007_29280 [Pseudomonas chlororaphis]